MKSSMDQGFVQRNVVVFLATKDCSNGNASEGQLKNLASAGRSVVNYEVRIVDEQGRQVPVGEVGEIIGKSEATMKRYWRLPKKSKEKLKGVGCTQETWGDLMNRAMFTSSTEE